MSTDDPMSIEDRVRAATRAGASLISDVRPLDAAAPVRLRRRPQRAPRRWVNWGVPLAAAAAVAAIALTLVAVRQAGTPAPASSGSGTAAPTAVPRYYVEPTYDSRAQRSGPLILGDDVTGKAIATVASPSGLSFNYAVGTSEDGMFVVQASAPAPYAAPPFSWYLLRVTPGGARPYQLTRLPVRLPGDAYARAFAVSPDGRELAVESAPGDAKARPVITVGIYSASTGARLRAWTAPTSITTDFTEHTLSWLDDGRRLVFSAAPAPAHLLQLRALDVTGAGPDLLADSKALFTVGNSATCASLQVTPDGGTAVCATRAGSPGASAGSAGCANGGLRLVAFPLPGDSSGKPARTLYQYPGACHDGTSSMLWSDASASSVIVVTSVNTASEGTKEAYRVGLVTGGRFTPLDIAKSIPAEGYLDLDF